LQQAGQWLQLGKGRGIFPFARERKKEGTFCGEISKRGEEGRSRLKMRAEGCSGGSGEHG